MMAIPMDDYKENSSRERVQHLFNKNVELEAKRRKAAQARIPSDPNAWQKMRENYEAIVLEDHAFSEQNDVEYALWQLHYRRIEELRALFNASLASSGPAAPPNGEVPSRAGPDRLTKIRSQLKAFLSETTGFYHDLMLKIRVKYGLPLDNFSDDPHNQISSLEHGNKFSEKNKGLISCHRCLIYLGDLARYKGLYGEGDSKAREFAAASSYYMQASSLWPSSGNPHHQVAILAGYSNDELGSIYCYFRSLAVENPFITARDNLIIAFEKNRQSYTQLLGDAKALVKAAPSRMPGYRRGKGETRTSIKDNKVEASSAKKRASGVADLLKAFITRFVRLNGILFTRTSLETFEEVFSMVRNDLLELLSSGPDEEFNFGSDAALCQLVIVRLIIILIFIVHDVSKENKNQSYADSLQRSVLLHNAFTATFEFMGYVLERCNKLNDPSSSFLLPGIMVFVEWLACNHNVAVDSGLEEKQANVRSFFWNNVIAFFNKLLSSGYVYIGEDEDETCFSHASEYDEFETANRLALPEDFELRGFFPLLPAQVTLDFSRKHSFGSDGGNKEKKARIQRIIAAGKALANVVQIGKEGIYFDTKLKKFLIGVEPQISVDYPLTSPLEDPKINGNSLENSVEGQVVLAARPKLEVDAEGEEDDEVIVFRPSKTEKHVSDFASKLTSSEVLASTVGDGRVHCGNQNGSVSVGDESFLLQGAPSTGRSIAVANCTSQYMLPVQPSFSKYLVEQAPTLNGLSHLSLMENGSFMKPALQDQLGVSQPAASAVPYPRFVNTDSGHNYPVQISQTAVTSKFDSIMYPRAATDGPFVKPSPAISAGIKKNPVNQPVRYFGPPPGFGSTPSKTVDESLNSMTLKNENHLTPQMDEHSWLDGYELSSNQSAGFNKSINHVGPKFPSASKNSGSMGKTSFPFPGKQVSVMQVQSQNQKSWLDYQLPEHLMQYQEQQQQFHGGNQHYVRSKKYQGQSPLESHFFV
ncbi:protein SMG7-like [Olea europaea var. sylvestris]|uniref:protein SMG7-like n=1 Tax=Olea europaea var. sylvestris TaxID=158386 RepID=UPI000C1D530E|nr:protein SMG7-like [Olea europaea var. sylvestris]XP_022872110.1 protein SMG7-like [Olea europaea var. sylvestris]XP_022872111.1 protein SMG7-like [Olea europaea var. sylvestris]XP_022872112.1 protein SMG7-like [Olea europaea var. sylvestris]XP_022872113.1 protein SMG7-like [Olea europaea var. sylvestris]XP_022872114.1 protein SMG7-like [Olea europaea var. sylvestris]XP_022872115.1 protein SMG7-like [Olea europaea var. sylvestris]